MRPLLVGVVVIGFAASAAAVQAQPYHGGPRDASRGHNRDRATDRSWKEQRHEHGPAYGRRDYGDYGSGGYAYGYGYPAPAYDDRRLVIYAPPPVYYAPPPYVTPFFSFGLRLP